MFLATSDHDHYLGHAREAVRVLEKAVNAESLYEKALADQLEKAENVLKETEKDHEETREGALGEGET